MGLGPGPMVFGFWDLVLCFRDLSLLRFKGLRI